MTFESGDRVFPPLKFARDHNYCKAIQVVCLKTIVCSQPNRINRVQMN